MIKKPKIYRKSSKRNIRIAKAGKAKDAIGNIEKGTDTFILTFGQFSLIDALVAILDVVGESTVDISTWTAADAHLEESAELIGSSKISKFRMVIDRSFETRQPGYCNRMRELFGENCIREIRTHSKFMVIRSATHNVVVRTSMNLNENPRLENIEVSESLEFAEFFTSIVDDIFSEVQPGEKKSKMLELASLQNTFQFPEVAANKIDRSSLNEPGATHQLKNN